MSDLEVTRSKSLEVWESGDYARLGGMMIMVGELLCEAVDLHAGERVLDVATGHGNTALAAARRFGDVTGVDLVPDLLARAQERASVERLPITFREGDAQALEFPDNHFDVVLSTFGCMFAPNQAQTAAELLRVCRPGGRIGIAAWTPGGQAGAVIQSLAAFCAPSAGATIRWHTTLNSWSRPLRQSLQPYSTCPRSRSERSGSSILS